MTIEQLKHARYAISLAWTTKDNPKELQYGRIVATAKRKGLKQAIEAYRGCNGLLIDDSDEYKVIKLLVYDIKKKSIIKSIIIYVYMGDIHTESEGD